MQEAVLYLNKVGKRKEAHKIKKTLPMIQRSDIMSAILSADLTNVERSMLSNLYAEITYMEKRDLKYISEIAVSSQNDLEIYEILKKLNKKSKG